MTSNLYITCIDMSFCYGNDGILYMYEVIEVGGYIFCGAVWYFIHMVQAGIFNSSKRQFKVQYVSVRWYNFANFYQGRHVGAY